MSGSSDYSSTALLVTTPQRVERTTQCGTLPNPFCSPVTLSRPCHPVYLAEIRSACERWGDPVRQQPGNQPSPKWHRLMNHTHAHTQKQERRVRDQTGRLGQTTHEYLIGVHSHRREAAPVVFLWSSAHRLRTVLKLHLPEGADSALNHLAPLLPRRHRSGHW